jgi:hypothetical protein
MERYIGLDVDAESTTLVVVSQTGRKLRQEVVETNGAALKQALRAIPGRKRLCLEEGAQSAWLYELLQGEAEDVVVTMPAKRAGPKDDARAAAPCWRGLPRAEARGMGGAASSPTWRW